MNIYVEKIELAKKVLDINDEETLQQIKVLLEGKEDDWWNELDDDGKASIERGLKQSYNNELLDHVDVMKNSL